jgi:nitrogen fixation protein NifB
MNSKLEVRTVNSPGLEIQVLRTDPKPFVAVGTKDGVLVDKHLGEVWAFQIWKPVEQGYIHLYDRVVAMYGTGRKRWIALADALKDCRTVLVSGIGNLPRHVLAQNGISVLEMNGFVTMGLDAVYQDRESVLLKGRRHHCSRGGKCSGRTGNGCIQK